MIASTLPRGKVTLVAVDWGTSHLRVWVIGTDGLVVDQRRSEEGMSSLDKGCFEGVLEGHLKAMSVGTDVPVIMCGMVGSRQGWTEAGYVQIPATLEQISAKAVRVSATVRDIRILPGLSKNTPAFADVMRGEETQLLGIAGLRQTENGGQKIVCLPGTHSKWVRLSSTKVEDFSSFITGDLFAALSSASILRHSLGVAPVDAASTDFRDAVEMSLAQPADILARLFSIRSASLLQGLSTEAARARLSGYLIGQEIAGALARFGNIAQVDLVASPALAGLYRPALEIAGLSCQLHDGDKVVIAGLQQAAASIWNIETA